MFGFLRPQCRQSEWRRSYARICQHQRRLFGLTSLPFLSYEATFLYQLAIDTGLINPLPTTAPECCRLRRLKEPEPAENQTAAIYCASFGMMLVGVKLQDDVADSGRWYQRLAAWKYRRQVRLAHDHLQTFHRPVVASVQSAIEQHAELESQLTARGLKSLCDIDAYCQPTGDGFAAVFAGLCHALQRDPDAERTEMFRAIGSSIGQSIIAWDCAVDFERDRMRGEFNPLRGTDDLQRSFEFCLLRLATIAWSLPKNSETRQIIAAVTRRTRARMQNPASSPIHRFERWGLIRERGFAYARCDGLEACCMVGECCECIGGASECGCGAAEAAGTCPACAPNCSSSPGRCCDGCFCCCDGLDNPKKRSTSDTDQRQDADKGSAAPYSEYLDQTGTADSALNPAGYVSIDGMRIPAKAASGEFIAAGQTVRVVGTDTFGISVVPS